jgi:hypothetical protein
VRVLVLGLVVLVRLPVAGRGAPRVVLGVPSLYRLDLAHQGRRRALCRGRLVFFCVFIFFFPTRN